MQIKPLFVGLICFLLGALGMYGQLFSESAEAMGIEHHHFDPNMMGGGVAVFDFNNDGYDDIYFTGGLNDDKLYENRGDGTFEDVTKKMRITAFGIVKTMGVVAGDIDNDGFTDLLVTTAENERCYLLRNEDGKSFKDISKAAGIDHEAWSMTATMADYDNDGDLDIYVSNYVAYDALPFDQNITTPLPDFFYENNGNLTFTQIATPLSQEESGCTLVSSFTDIDQDGDSDLFVLNDFGDFYVPNKLLLNDYPSNQFNNISTDVGIRSAINSMGLAVGDFDEDGDFDYYITNIGHNILYRQSEGKFLNEAQELEISDGTGTSWGTAFLDVNNDGFLDLYASRGTLLNLNDNQDNLLYVGSGSQNQFDDRRDALITTEPNKARGMAYGDFNNDGYLDIVTANIRIGEDNRAKTKVYMNTASEKGQWLKVTLSGTYNNSSAYGALVTIYSSGKEQIREVSGGSSYLSKHSNELHFGLDIGDNVDSLVVRWPRGAKREIFKDLASNTAYKILEDDGIYKIVSERILICPGESAIINGTAQTEQGVYTELVEDETSEIRTLKHIKLVIGESGIGKCKSVVELPQIEDPADLKMIIYPSPFDDTFQIASGNGFSQSIQVVLRDIAGQIVINERINTKGTSQLVVLSGYADLPAGVYIVTIISEGKTYIRKLLKS